jgi:leader peptidase (prepilin peptidase)/N-methyltransferase
MRRKRRYNWPLTVVWLLIAGLFCGYVFGWPWASYVRESLEQHSATLAIGPPPIIPQIRIHLFEFVVAAWIFMFGACLGSFLNVVIYRVPRGLSLLGGSRCPYCRAKIRWYDNLPVFGWLQLRGRCRDCHLPISPRYPLVEFAVGSMFLVLGVLELFLQGTNLPAEFPDVRYRVSWLAGRFGLDQIAACAYHCTLLSVLFSWALIKRDGCALPKRYVAIALAVGLAVPAISPSVQPVLWTSVRPGWILEYAWIGRVDTGVVGLSVGVLLGLLVGGVKPSRVGQVFAAHHIFRRLRRWAAKTWPTLQRRAQHAPIPQLDGTQIPASEQINLRQGHLLDVMAAFGVVGLYLGWQAMLSVAAIAACTRLVTAMATSGFRRVEHPTLFTHVFVATAIQICAWSALDRLAWWPGTESPTVSCAAVVILAVVLTLAADRAERAGHWFTENSS